MTILTWARKLHSSTSLRPSRGAQESQSRQQRSLVEFEHLYQLYSRELYSFCLETVGDRAEAEKLMQVAFLGLFCQTDAFHAGVNPKILLFRSVLAALRTRAEAEKEESSQVAAAGAGLASWPGAIGQQHLRNAIAELPPDLRVVFVLRDVLGYESGEIAEILESSPRISSWLAHQARLRVRETLSRAGRVFRQVVAKEAVPDDWRTPT
ncbi:MAG TPA: RNA polymerase sigma factor [Candidatus Sulfotelmatobacter sp.]|nr:RNA polymerase sigma factor [Candidatus Sulfotelmatobacter sp.]